MNGNKRSGLKIVKDKYFFVGVFCLGLLLMPEEIIQKTAIYQIMPPREIVYKYKSFYFSVLSIPAIILALGLFVSRKNREENAFAFVIVLNAIVDLIGSLMGNNSIIQENRIELYLVMLEAFAICKLFFYQKCIEDTKKLFNAYFILAFSTQILRLVLGMSEQGRYGAIGLGVGATGYFFSLYILYMLFCNDINIMSEILIIMALIGLMLSGQRTNLFVTLIFLALFGLGRCFGLRDKKLRGENRRMRFFWGVVGIGILAVVIILFLISIGVKVQGAEYINRIFDAVADYLNNELSQESSVAGRTKSIEAGLIVLGNNPLGIANDFYTLQKFTADAGYAIFPHSTILCCLLLWKTPIAIVILIYLIRLFLNLHKGKSPYQWLILYILILSVIWGSPFMESPLLFINLFFIILSAKEVRKSGIRSRRYVFVWGKHR